MLIAALFKHAQQRRVETVGQERIHVSPRLAGPGSCAEVGGNGIRDLSVADRILTFANRLAQCIDFLFPNFRLRQDRGFERLHSRLIEREPCLGRSGRAAFLGGGARRFPGLVRLSLLRTFRSVCS